MNKAAASTHPKARIDPVHYTALTVGVHSRAVLGFKKMWACGVTSVGVVDDRK